MKTPNTDALKSAVRSVPYRLTVIGCAAAAIGALALNYTDNRSTVGYTQVCFKPTNPKILKAAEKKGIQYCTSDERYWISDPILLDWQRTKPEFYNKLTRLKTIPPQTKDKWIYGAIAIAGGLGMAGLGAARLNLINKLAPGYRKEVHAKWHRDGVRNCVQMASDAIDGRFAVQHKLAQAEANYGRYQAAILTPDEIVATQQAYLDAESQARMQGVQDAQYVAGNDQAQLPGQSLDDVNNPGDKVNGASNENMTIKPALIQTLQNSAIAPILKAGVLKVIGGQGSGKTTLVNGGLLRYRLQQGHKLIIINPHKSFEMYRGLEPHLVTSTEFYGVGADDATRATSLAKGLTTVLGILETRYTEYQNQPVGSYNHYPITILIEECGEWAGLLGEKGLPLIQHFWQKMFIACRKGRFFPIITAQHDTMAMFGNPKGLAELIKSSGAVTLNLIAEPDSNSPDGWRPSGKGVLYIPNNDAKKIDVPDIRNLVSNPDVFTDLFSAPSQPANQSANQLPKQDNSKLNVMRGLIADCWTKDDKDLSEDAQKLIAWIRRKVDEGKTMFTIEMCRASGCVPNAKSPDIKRLLSELIEANVMTLKDGGVYEMR
ncbi:hypothetical protein DSM106972_097490 [Dulcicalothrix desertica PCC 7102]|uniref:Uncharacterized protein n=1 Tax=Dulcicalothrix desertica PCC 7102 TaxID=232991 RepID=A0A3S1AIR8_9CYAN|nr:ATP-binding protein [Dulcicalothrix desertica]RUS93117.1 hypothetical protein DSM106972_097490 [Dulcicalothrix desertica PCC 7102]TWH61193.1 hypothetical protein CAL7102_01048 [Dulcicalothrix desertica PCC 7102]